MYQIVYDGSFEGFLSAYHFYRENGSVESVINKNLKPVYQPSIYSVEIDIEFCKVKEIVEFINKKSSKLYKKVYFAYLCDTFNIELTVFKYIDLDNWEDSREDIVIDIEKRIYNLFSERHKLLGFIRFSELKDGTLIAYISPKNNILPLIGSHFRKRFGNLKWAIVDKIRRDILYYDGYTINYGRLQSIDKLEFSENELLMRKSWKAFFETISIKERENYERQRGKVPLWIRENMVEFQ
jgi:probable DNA metabolism protein